MNRSRRRSLGVKKDTDPQATFNGAWDITDEAKACLEFLDASGNVLSNIPAAGTYKIRMKEGVTIIRREAFYNCTSLTRIAFPNSVTTISIYVFADCTSLTSVTIPNSVTGIGEFAFANCASLTSVTMLPKNPPAVGVNIFYELPSNAKVYVPAESAVAGKYGTVGSIWNDLTVAIIP